MAKKENQCSFQIRFSDKTMAQVNELKEFLNQDSLADTIRQAIAERYKIMLKQKEGYKITGIKDKEKVEFLF